MDKNQLILASWIMRAAAEGRTLHYRPRRGGDWVQADPLTAKWNWGINEYKAEGVEMQTTAPLPPPVNQPIGITGILWNNPDNVSPEDVGVGWRLLTNDEMGTHIPRDDISIWSAASWSSHGEGLFPALGQTFRTQSPLPPRVPQPTLNWQNPVGLTLEQLGEGWRFCLVSEMDRLPEDGEYWDRHRSPPRWERSFNQGRSVAAANREQESYRTRQPLPASAVPLGRVYQSLVSDEANALPYVPCIGALTIQEMMRADDAFGGHGAQHEAFPATSGHMWEQMVTGNPEENHDVEDIPM